MMRRNNNLTPLLILLQLILLWPIKTGAFSVIQLLHSSRLVETVSAFALYASQNKDNTNNNSDKDDDDGPLFSSSSSQSSLQNFNPFQPVSSNRNQNQYYNPIKSNSINININNNNVLSLRKLQMQSILQDLLAVTNDEMMTISTKQLYKTILHAHRDFLLAPFTDNDFADDDPDSIYQSSHPSPSARWETFHTTMTSRIQAARNPSVQIVLEALLEYVQQELEVEQEQQS